MKITIKLDKRKAGFTKLGYPIVVYASKNYKDKQVRIGYYAKVNEWNDKFAVPKQNHPEFYVLVDLVENLKAKITKIIIASRTNNIGLADLRQLLFKEDHNLFYAAAIDYLGADYRGSEYSAVKSFNDYYPAVSFEEVTYSMVASFILKLTKKGNKPAGIDSYIRSLRAIWNKTTELPNPFSKHKITIPKKVNPVSTLEDLRKLEAAELQDRGAIGGHDHYRDYWLAMFYLGGVDPEVIKKLRWDKNYHNGRVFFNRKKGGSSMPCNNIMSYQLWLILKKYIDSWPYFFPIYRSKSYKGFMKNFHPGLSELSRDLNLSVKIHPKSARYTFIDRLQQQLIDERIAAQIVGHKRKTTTSLYPNDFPIAVQDAAHLKVIEL